MKRNIINQLKTMILIGKKKEKELLGKNNKKKLKIARNKIDRLDKSIFNLIKKRIAVVKYILSLKQFKKQIVDHKISSYIHHHLQKM